MSEEKKVKEWTLMFYFASDNPLASHIVSQLKAIKDAGFHKEANVIAYFDPHPKNTPSHVFDVNLVEKLKHDRQRFSFGANDPFVRNLVFDRLWTDKDKATKDSIRTYLRDNNHIDYDSDTKPVPNVPNNLSDEQSPNVSLEAFLTFCQTTYPARHYMLIILGHGVVVGNDIFLFDENIPNPEVPSEVSKPANPNTDSTSPPSSANANNAATADDLPRHSVTLQELGRILREFKQKIAEHNGQLELLGLHSCSMSGLEVAYEIQDSAKYLLASQGPAFVGSWPYKQILTRVFNDLDRDPAFEASDFEVTTLIEKLNLPDNQYLTGLFQDPSILTNNADTEQFRADLTHELNRLLKQPTLCQSAWAGGIKKSAETDSLNQAQPQGTGALWLNRMLLQDAFPDAFPDEQKKKYKPTLKEMLVKIFYYCIHNSYDFQLAGYSFDMALCDLSRLKDPQQGVTVPLQGLSSALIAGLKATDKSVKGLIKGLILLAHWDAQSFWQEQYTDLYDFCFCLKRRSEGYVTTQPAVNQISAACQHVMNALERGKDDDYDRLIVRSEFIGPAFQYSRGLSVFFPWSEPVDKTFLPRYADYKFTKELDQGSQWLDFLRTYFVETRRGLRKDEEIPTSKDFNRVDMEKQLLAVLQNISTSISRDGSQLDGPPPGKGPGDPTGDDCDCPSIKNYPSSTDTLNKEGEEKQEPAYESPIGLNIAEHFSQF